MGNNNYETALKWIVEILNKHSIKYQIVGGLAASTYGSSRKLWDIDLTINEKDFDKIAVDAKPYLIEGPENSKSDSWDCYYMEIKYDNTIIEIGGSENTKIFNSKSRSWEKFNIDLDKFTTKDIFGMKLPIIPKENLIAYKKILNRDVDKVDIKEIS